MDQIGYSGPYEVLAALSGSTYTTYGLTTQSVGDWHGLRLQPDSVLDDDRPRKWLQTQASNASCVLSLCTGTLLLGAAGLLRGRRAISHSTVVDLLPLFGSTVVDQRVVTDDRFVFASGVTAGIDAALTVAAILRGAVRPAR